MNTKKENLLFNWLIADITFDIKRRTYTKQKEKFLLLTARPVFKDAIHRLRAEARVPQDGFSKFEVGQSWARNLSDVTKGYLNAELSRILKSLDIGERWQQAIEYYWIFNQQPQDELIPQPVDYMVENSNTALSLKVYKDTTLDDIKEIWPDIKEQQVFLGRLDAHSQSNYKKRTGRPRYDGFVLDPKKKRITPVVKWQPKRFGSYKNFREYQKAYEMRENSKSYKDIAKALGWGDASWEKVSIYIKRFKDAVEKNELY